MGYVKGSIDVSSSQDSLLLELVLRSRHITHTQLWQFLQLKTGERRRRIFNWRVLRLVRHGLITRIDARHSRREWVYAISPAGASYLSGKGDGAALVASKAFKQLEDPVVLHSLDLNELHLALLRTGDLVRWRSELEIVCLNELTGFGYAKDYDAIATVDTHPGECAFAIEYERHPKAAERYFQIRERLESERHLALFLYIVPSYELLGYISGFFQRFPRSIHFGVLSDVLQDGLDAKVFDSRRTRSTPLRAILVGSSSLK